MSRSDRPRRAARRRAVRRLGVVALALLAAGACGRIIAPPPPSTAPNASYVAVVAGVRITIAARAARILQDAAFTTRRFSSDSTWGFRAVDSLSARLRYVQPSNDSTRVLIELWGNCRDRSPHCLRNEIAAIVQLLQVEEAPPP